MKKTARGYQDKDCFDTARRRETDSGCSPNASCSRARNGTGSAIHGYRLGTSPYHIDIDGKNCRFFIPDEALDVFNDEFDYRKTANSHDLTDMAAALFVGMLDTSAVLSRGGGGSDSNDQPWGGREDEREGARRCAREAAREIGKKPKTGRKR